MPAVITVGYLLVSLWVSFIAGLAAGNVPKKDEITVYRIGVDYEGKNSSVCRENGPVDLEEFEDRRFRRL